MQAASCREDCPEAADVSFYKKRHESSEMRTSDAGPQQSSHLEFGCTQALEKKVFIHIDISLLGTSNVVECGILIFC